MSCALHEDDLLRLARFGKDFVQLLLRTELILAAADEQLRLRALAQKRITIKPVVNLHRGTQRDDRLHSRVRTSCAHAGRRSERKSAEDERQMELAVEPVQCGAHVVDLTAAVVVTAFTQSRSAKIETQDW